MNKNILLTVLFTFGFCNFSYGLNREQRELLYTLHYLNQDFSSISMIAENIDTFIDVFQSRVKINEKKLEETAKARNVALFNSMKKIGAIWLLSVLMNILHVKALNEGRTMRWEAPTKVFYECILNKLSILNMSPEIDLLKKAAYVYSGVQLYESFKEERNLNKALMLDKEVLSKLQEVKNAEMEKVTEE